MSLSRPKRRYRKEAIKKITIYHYNKKEKVELLFIKNLGIIYLGNF